MGLLDILTGRRRLAPPARDRLFAISTAYVAMETAHQVHSRGSAAIVFQALGTSDFRGIVTEMEDVVRATASDSGGTVRSVEDEYGYSWMVIDDDGFDDLVVAINAVSTALIDGGYGERVLCAVFAFADDRDRPLYWIYNYKRGTFSPFVPAGADSAARARDNERELVLRAQMAGEMPVEDDLTRWFALWGIPI
jgi:hypothetical protein